MILSFLASSLAGSTPGNPRQLPGMKMYSRLNVDSTRRRRRPPFRRPYPRFSRRLGAATVIIRVASRRPRGWQCPEPGAPAVHHHAPAFPNHPLAGLAVGGGQGSERQGERDEEVSIHAGSPRDVRPIIILRLLSVGCDS